MKKGLIVQNTLVKQVIAQIEQRLKAGVREPYQKIVVAGSKYAMSGGTGSILASLKDSQNVVDDCVKGAIGLVGSLRRAAKGVMPTDAMIPAGMTLALEALDFAERIGKLKVDRSVIDQATQLYVETLMPKLGITPAKLAQVTAQVHGVMSDPDKMAKLHGIGNAPAAPQPGAR